MQDCANNEAETQRDKQLRHLGVILVRCKELRAELKRLGKEQRALTEQLFGSGGASTEP